MKPLVIAAIATVALFFAMIAFGVANAQQEPPHGRISASSFVCKNGVVVAFHIKVDGATEGNIYLNHEGLCGSPS